MKLQQMLERDTRKIIISMIHKFRDANPNMNTRDNIIVLVDEAHRTQEGDLGRQMRAALPNAFLFGLTGTPINKADKELNKFFKKYYINLVVDQKYFPISNNKVSKLNVIFSTSFGRQLEYYTGMVFKIDIKSNNKIKNIINGGRYDQLISDLGSKNQVSAVGAALNLNY